MTIQQTGIATLLLLCVCVLPTYAGQNAQPNRAQAPGAAGDTIVPAESFPIKAPAVVPIPPTNTPPPPGALFAAPDGKESHPGTQQDAPTTVEKALRTAPVGGTIVFRGGTYRLGNLGVPRKLTLQAFPGEQPWFKGSVVVGRWVKDGTLWRHDGWTAEWKPEGRLDKIVNERYPMAVHGDQAFLEGKALFQVKSREQVKPGQFYVDHQSDALYLGDDPKGKTVEATMHGSGLDVVQRDLLKPGGSVVRGLGFTHYARQGMIVSAPNVVIENCAFVWNGNRGLFLTDGRGEMPADCVVRGSTLSANGQAGLSANRASRLLFEKNRVSHNNVEGFNKQWGAAGIKFFGFDGLVCRDNVTEYNNAHCIWLDVNANKATVVGNVSRFNQGSGIFFEISDQAIIAFNVCRQNTIGIHVSNAHNARVYNNTLVDNERGVRVLQGARINNGKEGGTPDDTVVANTAPGAMFTVRGNIFKNNLLWNTRTDAARALFDFDMNPTLPPSARRSDEMVVALSHNAYHRAEAANPPNVQAWSLADGPVKRYATLAEFVAASGKGQSSLQTTGGDPYFVDAVKEDFHLKAGSPALGKAEPLPHDVARAAGVDTNIGYLGALPPAFPNKQSKESSK